MSVCLIGLGSNQGNRQAALDAAAARLAAHPQIDLLARSTWHETAAVGGPAGQADFLNGRTADRDRARPRKLLACLQEVETQLGRRRAERWGPRPIDLDLLLYGELVLDAALVLPHPRLACRRFVLAPAAEVAGTMLHPTIRWSIAQLLGHLDTVAALRGHHRPDRRRQDASGPTAGGGGGRAGGRRAARLGEVG